MLTSNQGDNKNVITVTPQSQQNVTASTAPQGTGMIIQQNLPASTSSNIQVIGTPPSMVSTQMVCNTTSITTTQPSSSSLIKSLLANKVTTITDANSTAANTSIGSNLSTCLISPNVNVHQVTIINKLTIFLFTLIYVRNLILYL